MFKDKVYTRSQREKCPRSINMETEVLTWPFMQEEKVPMQL
jgi:hypothetical protein